MLRADTVELTIKLRQGVLWGEQAVCGSLQSLSVTAPSFNLALRPLIKSQPSLANLDLCWFAPFQGDVEELRGELWRLCLFVTPNVTVLRIRIAECVAEVVASALGQLRHLRHLTIRGFDILQPHLLTRISSTLTYLHSSCRSLDGAKLAEVLRMDNMQALERVSLAPLLDLREDESAQLEAEGMNVAAREASIDFFIDWRAFMFAF